VLQGGFVLAKALNDRNVVLDAIAHLKRYVEQLLPPNPGRKSQ
jgi:TetR/AcrR family transcriptional repressor of nem operon